MIHLVETTDVDVLLPMMRDYYAHDHLEFDANRAARAVRGLLETERGKLWSILEGDAVLGYAVLVWSYSLEYGGLAAEVDELYLAPQARGRGVGRAALASVLEFCRAEGVVLLRLETEPSNAAARGFYEHLGFVSVKRAFMQLEL